MRKHIKLFEDFNEDDFDIDFFVLKDGRRLIFWEEPFKDMGGETNSMVKFRVGDAATKITKDNVESFGEEVTFKQIEGLLEPINKGELIDYMDSVSDGNADRSREFNR
jgi:hypothetical protein